MASTGIIQRRDIKADLITDPPITGEIVFALDTGEHGWLDETDTLVWKKLNEAVASGPIIDYTKVLISSAGEAGPAAIFSRIATNTTSDPSSFSSHALYAQFEIIAGNNIGYKSDRLHIGQISLVPGFHGSASVQFTTIDNVSWQDADTDSLEFQWSQSSEVPFIFNDSGANDGVAGTYKIVVELERISGDEVGITEYFNNTTGEYTNLVGGG